MFRQDYIVGPMLSADLGGGGGGGDVTDTTTTQSGAPPAPDAAAASAPAAAAPTTPAAPQGFDYEGLARQHGGPEGLQQRLQYFQELEQRYKSDPAWAQKYDQLYGGQQQQPAGHPYDWMTADEKRLAELREKGDQHPDHPRLVAEFTNFFQNPIGQLGQYVTHPKVQEALFGALAPQMQDMVSRMMQQSLQPVQQYIHQQGEQQFRAQYEKPFLALPDSIKQLHQQGRFGQGREGIINAIEAGKILAQQQAAGEVPGQPPVQGRPAVVNKNTAVNKPSAPASREDQQSRFKDEDEEYAKKLAAARTGKK